MIKKLMMLVACLSILAAPMAMAANGYGKVYSEYAVPSTPNEK